MKRLATLALALCLSSCASAPKLTGKAAPDFTLTDQDGKAWSSAALKGDTLLIDFWATWCVPCLQAVPDLNAFNDRHSGQVKLLGLAIEEKGWDVVAPAVAKHHIRYPVAVGHTNLASAFGVEGFPYLVLVKNGKIEKQLLGKHSLAELESELAEYLP